MTTILALVSNDPQVFTYTISGADDLEVFRLKTLKCYTAALVKLDELTEKYQNSVAEWHAILKIDLEKLVADQSAWKALSWWGRMFTPVPSLRKIGWNPGRLSGDLQEQQKYCRALESDLKAVMDVLDPIQYDLRYGVLIFTEVGKFPAQYDRMCKG